MSIYTIIDNILTNKWTYSIDEVNKQFDILLHELKSINDLFIFKNRIIDNLNNFWQLRAKVCPHCQSIEFFTMDEVIMDSFHTCSECKKTITFWQSTYTIFEVIPYNIKRCFRCECTPDDEEFICMYELLESEKNKWVIKSRCGHFVDLSKYITRFA